MVSRLDLQTLRLFSVVATLRNIAKAAEQEHIAPSAVSKRISELEAALGTKLFYRLRRGVDLAPAGLALLHHTTAIFHRIERLESDMAEYAQGVRGHVRMMANLTSIVQYLTKDLSSFAIAHPEIKIDLTESSTPAIIKATSDGLIDFGIIADVRVNSAGEIAPGLVLEDYRQERLVLIVPAKHPLSTRKVIRFRDAANYDFIGLHAHGGWDSLMDNGLFVEGPHSGTELRCHGALGRCRPWRDGSSYRRLHRKQLKESSTYTAAGNVGGPNAEDLLPRL
jgi:DNA-binding transcriptional LysR family regulator